MAAWAARGRETGYTGKAGRMTIGEPRAGSVAVYIGKAGMMTVGQREL
jgi:hypothetical protein